MDSDVALILDPMDGQAVGGSAFFGRSKYAILAATPKIEINLSKVSWQPTAQNAAEEFLTEKR